MIRRLALLAGLVLGCLAPSPGRAGCEPLALAPLLDGIAPAIRAERLANGLRVVLAPDPQAHSVTLRIAYDVGSRDDPSGRGGLAHFVEHLMFKGSGEIADGEHFRRVRDAGGRVNALTDWDLTEYVDTVPPAALDRVLVSEADRMRGLRLLATSLETQRAAIQEEEALRISNVPYARAASDFLGRLWQGTPYDHAPTGSEGERQATDLADVARFHADYYAPDNAALVLVGRFDPDEARDRIETLFGSIEPGTARPPRAPIEVERTPRHEVLEDELAPFPVYGLAWHAVGAGHPDAPALAVVDELLLGHRDARLARVLRGPLVFDAYSLSFALRDAGLVNFVFAPRTFASFDEIHAAVDSVLQTLVDSGPGEAELCRAIRDEQLERLAGLETTEGLAGALSRGVMHHADPRHFAAELQALATLSKESVRETAARVLDQPPSTVVIMPAGVMRWLKPVLEVLPDGIGASLERSLL